MLKILGLSFFVLGLNPMFADSPEENHTQKTEDLMVRVMDHYKLPSFSMAIAVDGKIIFASAKGYADVEEEISATPDTQYSVGSVAKPMTAIALARLIDMERINLDEMAQTYIPALGFKETFTVRQLAAHTSGIGRPFKARDAIEFQNVRDYQSPFQLMDLIEAEPLQSKPGSKFQYTSTGYILLSALIEKTSGTSYLNFMKEAVFSPLKMRATVHDTSQAGVKFEAKYYQEKNAEGVYLPATANRDRSFLFGGGGYISTPTDLVKLAGAFFDEGFLNESTKAALVTPMLLDDGSVNEQVYGLGWRMGKMSSATVDGKELDVIHHGGITDGAANAFLIIIPEYKAAMAFAMNTVPDKFWQIRGIMTKDLMNYLTD